MLCPYCQSSDTRQDGPPQVKGYRCANCGNFFVDYNHYHCPYHNPFDGSDKTRAGYCKFCDLIYKGWDLPIPVPMRKL